MAVAGCKYLKRFTTCNFICHKKDGGYSKICSFSSCNLSQELWVWMLGEGLGNLNAQHKCHTQ